MKYLKLYILLFTCLIFKTAQGQDMVQIVSVKASLSVMEANTHYLNAEISVTNWKEGVDLFIVISKEQGGNAVFTYQAIVGKRNGVQGLMLKDGSFVPAENNRIRIKLPVKDIPITLCNIITVHTRTIAGQESQKQSTKIEK